MGMREENTDNNKHGPARTKAEASTPAKWPYAMGDWDAPGVQIVTDTDSAGIDDTQERYRTGPVNSNPVSPNI